MWKKKYFVPIYENLLKYCLDFQKKALCKIFNETPKMNSYWFKSLFQSIYNFENCAADLRIIQIQKLGQSFPLNVWEAWALDLFDVIPFFLCALRWNKYQNKYKLLWIEIFRSAQSMQQYHVQQFLLSTKYMNYFLSDVTHFELGLRVCTQKVCEEIFSLKSY